jgi:hypothetical protein
MATAELIGAEMAIYESMSQRHPAHVLVRRVGDLSDAIENLHKTLIDAAKQT